MAFCDKEERLHDVLRRFWEIEERTLVRERTAEQQCETFFVQKHQRTADGRYVVGIPLRSDISEIGSSREAALRRFHALESRFNRDPELGTKYVKGMNELIDAGFATRILAHRDRI